MFEAKQCTISSPVRFEGVGVNSGKAVIMEISPAPANTGIVFQRTDLLENNKVSAKYDNVTHTQLCTKITNKAGISVALIEHLLAALWGAGVDNAIVKTNQEELAIMDGSSEDFMLGLDSAGIVVQEADRQFLEILKPVRVGNDSAYIEITPNDKFVIDMEVEYPAKFIGKQRFHFDASSHKEFKRQLARARTFVMEEEVEKLRSMGLAKGGSLANVVVVKDDHILNENGLRYERDEFVRHKVLDCIGDMYLAGFIINGKITASKTGHGLNNQLLRTLFSDQDAWRRTTLEEFYESEK